MYKRISSTHLHLESTSFSSPLFTLQNMEVIIRRVPPRVTLCTEWSSKQDQVLGNRSVNDKHVSHCSSRVIPNPFPSVWGVGFGNDRLSRRIREEGSRGEGVVDGEIGMGLFERSNNVGED